MANVKVRVKGNKKGLSNFFKDGKFVPAGEVVEVPMRTYENSKDQLELVGSVEDPGVQEVMRKQLEAKRAETEAAEAAAKAKAEADAAKAKK